jgi:hypothetical protein
MDEAEVEGFLDEMLLCFPVLGLSVFHKPVAAVKSDRKLFLKGKGLSAEGYESPEGFVVLAGGRAAFDESLRAGGLGSECERLSAKRELWNPAKGHTHWSETTHLARRLKLQLSCSAAPQTAGSNERTVKGLR